MPKDLEKEMDEMAEAMEKSVKTPKEKLQETIVELGAEGLRKALPNLSDEDKTLLSECLEDMKKAVEMDDEYQAKVRITNINESNYQEEKADDDQDEKLVKPEAAKMNHQGTPTEGWEGQVIKGKKKLTRELAENAIMQMEEEEHGTKDPKKLLEAEKKEKKMDKACMKKSEPTKEELLELKKAIEAELGEEATPELVKAEMKKRMLKEEDQLSDTDEATKGKDRGDKSRPEALKTDEDNKKAQKKVDDLGQACKEPKMKKSEEEKTEEAIEKAINWADENSLLKARTGGRNHHFSVNGFYDEALAKSKEEPKEEKLNKSEGSEEKSEDLNDLIEKGKDTTWGDLECESLTKSNQEKVNGKVFKSFQENEIAAALGLSEEEAKKILGE